MLQNIQTQCYQLLTSYRMNIKHPAILTNGVSSLFPLEMSEKPIPGRRNLVIWQAEPNGAASGSGTKKEALSPWYH
jgi:hypothetical protein